MPRNGAAREVLRLGASGYLLKTSAGWELLQAVDSALRGLRYVTPVLKHVLDPHPVSGPDASPSFELTARQREVLRLLAQGHSMKQVAAALGVDTGPSPSTSTR